MDMFKQDILDKLYLKRLPDLVEKIESVEGYIKPEIQDLEFEEPYMVWRVEDRVIAVVTGRYNNTFMWRKTMDKNINEWDVFNMTNFKRWMVWLNGKQ